MTKPDKAAKPKKRKASASKPNLDDFVSVARRLEADEDKDRFEAKLKKIAKSKSAP